VGQVLQRLPSKDVEAARQVCRLLDAASRTQLESASTVTLGPHNAQSAVQHLNWSRFPRLRTVNIQSWHQARDLRSCFAVSSRGQLQTDQALANLAQVTTLGIKSSRGITSALMATLSVMPNVTTLHVSGSNLTFQPVPDQMAAVAAMAVLARQLVDLKIDFLLHQQQAAYLTEHLTNLRSLRVLRGIQGLGNYGGDDDGVRAALWAALPCSRLTSLQVANIMSYAAPLPSDLSSLSLPWLQMRELRGVDLPFAFVEQLAAGLPNLQLLHASPKGQWGPTPAVFRQLKQLRLYDCEDGLSGAWFPELFPVVERCVLQAELYVDEPELCYNVGGMNAVTHLCISTDGILTPQLARTIEAVASLCRLQELVWWGPGDHLQQLPVLSRVSTLRSLYVGVKFDDEDFFDFAEVLTAVSSLTTLESLTINAIAPRLNFATLAHALRTLPTSLQHLRIRHPYIGVMYLSLAQVATIAAHPGLRTLSFLPSDCAGCCSGSCSDFCSDQDQFDRVEFETLVAQWKPHGLHIKDIGEDRLAFDRDEIADWIRDIG